MNTIDDVITALGPSAVVVALETECVCGNANCKVLGDAMVIAEMSRTKWRGRVWVFCAACDLDFYSYVPEGIEPNTLECPRCHQREGRIVD